MLEASVNVMNSDMASGGDVNVEWELVVETEKEKAELMVKYNALEIKNAEG